MLGIWLITSQLREYWGLVLTLSSTTSSVLSTSDIERLPTIH